MQIFDHVEPCANPGAFERFSPYVFGFMFAALVVFSANYGVLHWTFAQIEKPGRHPDDPSGCLAGCAVLIFWPFLQAGFWWIVALLLRLKRHLVTRTISWGVIASSFLYVIYFYFSFLAPKFSSGNPSH